MRVDGCERKAPRWLMVGLLAVALAALAPATAFGNASANIRRAPGTSADFTLGGSNGYSLYFKSEKGHLRMIASQRRPTQATISPSGKLVPARLGAASESTYVVNGVSSDPSTIEADLGSAGKVSLIFQPSGAKKVTTFDLSDKSERCLGATKVVRRLGNFVGTVSFHGENGYTTAEATSVPGTVGTSPFRNCTTIAGRRALADRPASETQAFLSVPGKTSFLAIRDEKRARFFAGEGEELSSGFAVFRTASAAGSSRLFPFSLRGLTASVRPPAPFSGFGLYRKPASGPPTWSGNLSVDFPGFERALTGDRMIKPVLKVGR